MPSTYPMPSMTPDPAMNHFLWHLLLALSASSTATAPGPDVLSLTPQLGTSPCSPRGSERLLLGPGRGQHQAAGNPGSPAK